MDHVLLVQNIQDHKRIMSVLLTSVAEMNIFMDGVIAFHAKKDGYMTELEESVKREVPLSFPTSSQLNVVTENIDQSMDSNVSSAQITLEHKIKTQNVPVTNVNFSKSKKLTELARNAQRVLELTSCKETVLSLLTQQAAQTVKYTLK